MMRPSGMGILMSMLSAYGGPASLSPMTGHTLPVKKRQGGKTGSRPFRPRSQKKRRIHMRQQGAYR